MMLLAMLQTAAPAAAEALGEAAVLARRRPLSVPNWTRCN